ncbi:MAG: hypothetical protein U1D67_09920, partial [Dehalococcoidia bacterium]|nr:hypothetical protein [Dehalococcoidia bacterium]
TAIPASEPESRRVLELTRRSWIPAKLIKALSNPSQSPFTKGRGLICTLIGSIFPFIKGGLRGILWHFAEGFQIPL